MADTNTPKDPETFTRRWGWPLGILTVLLLVAVLLVVAAQSLYDKRATDSFERALAKDVLLNAAMVAIFGAVIATVLSRVAEIRSWKAADSEKQLGLFRRMRDTHLGVVDIQQVLRARRDPKTYEEQMQMLQRAVKDMEEIREEVKVSSRLYDSIDRRMIMTGIDLLGIYLHEGVDEYVEWRTSGDSPNMPKKRPEKRPDGQKSWVSDLVDEHGEVNLAAGAAGNEGNEPEPLAGDDHYAPPGGMPPRYEDGLEFSKLIMRLYIYEPLHTERDAKRAKIRQKYDKYIEDRKRGPACDQVV
jgi:2C-methyl-D-erythritol 2,4-cyclodiphosphate synthase